MDRRRAELDRRVVLGAATGAVAAALLGRKRVAAAQPLLRRIPATGELLPAIGMGSWITFNVGEDGERRDRRVEVLREFFAAGGAVIDSSPMYGSSEAVIGYGLERTDGVPLFVEELTKAVLEAGGRGVAGALAASAPAALAVPATLHASLMARLDRLGPAARAAAQVGAVIGREFSSELLAAVASSGEGELAAALDQLTGAGLVFRRGEGAEADYLFKHALVRDAAYGTLLRDRRRLLHGSIAHALEKRFPELAETTPELLANHLTEAGEVGRAVRYWLEAGRRSAERSADREAVSHLRRGLETLTGLPASAERDRMELEFQLAIGTPLIALSGWSGPQVAVAYERAGALCDSLGDAVA